jgi:hypothetical protein
LADDTGDLRDKAAAFMRAGGIFGSINHDTYDPRENVAYFGRLHGLDTATIAGTDSKGVVRVIPDIQVYSGDTVDLAFDPTGIGGDRTDGADGSVNRLTALAHDHKVPVGQKVNIAWPDSACRFCIRVGKG